MSELSDEEQTRSGLKDCSEQEFNLFKDLNSRFKNKFNIPFIFAVASGSQSMFVVAIYTYISGWLHYFCTEKEDFKIIYGNK